MKKFHFLFHPVVIFIFAQLAWLSLLGLWIYWYVSNYIIFSQVGERISPQLAAESTNIIALISGLILLVAILVGMFLIFIYLNKQLSITRLYDNFIGNVTHELKSPLASIQLYLETMSMRDIPRPRQKEFITLMIKDANRLKNLINSILEISAHEQKKIAYDYRVVTAELMVKKLVDESIEFFKLPADAIKLAGTASCQCVVDQNAMKIVFNNLIDNAIKYSAEPVQLMINMACTAGKFVLQFIDQGVGIAEKDQKKVFKKFHRVYDHDSPNVKGTGLGLYWIKEIVRYHGGKVAVFSEGKNRGSTFKIELPIYQTSKKRYINQLLKLIDREKKNKKIGFNDES